jgi:FAD/FMN-containing dehydrogenase
MIRGYGPTQTDFGKLTMAAQGTMGIITWATIKCKRIPAFTETLLVPSDDIRSLTDLVYKTLWRRIGNQMMVVNNATLASLCAETESGIQTLRDRLPPWMFICCFEGTGLRPDERVAWQKKVFEDEAQKRGLKPENRVSGLTGEDVFNLLCAPSPDPFWKTRYKGGNQDIFFITTLDQTPGFIERMNEWVAVHRFPTTEIGIYLQPTVQGTNCHCEFHMPYNPRNALESDRVKTLNETASQGLANMGAFFSRPYGRWSRVAFGRDPATVNALRKIKNIFDPKGIMNPGKLCF